MIPHYISAHCILQVRMDPLKHLLCRFGRRPPSLYEILLLQVSNMDIDKTILLLELLTMLSRIETKHFETKSYLEKKKRRCMYVLKR